MQAKVNFKIINGLKLSLEILFGEHILKRKNLAYSIALVLGISSFTTVSADISVLTGVSDFTYQSPSSSEQSVPVSLSAHPAWITEDSGSWIGPVGGNTGAEIGTHVYTYTFSLLNTNNVTISGNWSSDNGTVAYLNGNRIINSPGGWTPTFRSLHTLAVSDSSLFQVGMNELRFEVENGLGATGLYVNANITTTPVERCSDILDSKEVSMGLIEKFEWSGNGYTHAEGTKHISISGDASSGEWFVINPKLIDVDAVIIKGATGTYVYYYEPDAKARDVFSNLKLPLNNGGQIPDISNIQFCEDGHFDSKDAEVCLWTADQDKDGSYINIEQVGCIEAEKHKFYAIEAGGEFSSVLEAE